MIGPLAMVDPLEYDLSLTDAELLRQAESVGMTRAYLSRMLVSVAGARTAFRRFVRFIVRA